MHWANVSSRRGRRSTASREAACVPATRLLLTRITETEVFAFRQSTSVEEYNAFMCTAMFNDYFVVSPENIRRPSETTSRRDLRFGVLQRSRCALIAEQLLDLCLSDPSATPALLPDDLIDLEALADGAHILFLRILMLQLEEKFLSLPIRIHTTSLTTSSRMQKGPRQSGQRGRLDPPIDDDSEADLIEILLRLKLTTGRRSSF